MRSQDQWTEEQQQIESDRVLRVFALSCLVLLVCLTVGGRAQGEEGNENRELSQAVTLLLLTLLLLSVCPHVLVFSVGKRVIF